LEEGVSKSFEPLSSIAGGRKASISPLQVFMVELLEQIFGHLV
jgi:hypothetical protein